MISLPDIDLFLYTTMAALSSLLHSYPDTHVLSISLSLLSETTPWPISGNVHKHQTTSNCL